MQRRNALVTQALDFVGPPAGRLGRAEEIGELVSFLAGMRGSFPTGSIIPFAGGWPAAPPRPGQ